MASILNIMGNGPLEIVGINVRGVASRHLLGAIYVPNLRAVGFAFWPTIFAQPGAKVRSLIVSKYPLPLNKLSHEQVYSMQAGKRLCEEWLRGGRSAEPAAAKFASQKQGRR